MLNRSLLDSAAIADQGTINGRRPHGACRQETCTCIDGSSRFVKPEFGIGVGQVKTRLEEGADCSNILPIPLKDIGLHLIFPDGYGNDIFAEVGKVILEAFLENVSLKYVDTHRSLIKIGRCG